MQNTRRKFLIESTAAAGALRAQTPQEKKDDIFVAASSGDVSRATELVNADPQLVRQRSSAGLTALHYATAAGKPAMVQFLVLRGAEFNAGPENALLAAIDCPDHGNATEMSWFMLANGADPNAIRKDGKTALGLAQARGYDDLVEMLIHRGARSGKAPGIDRIHFDRRYLHDVEGRPFKRDDTKGLSWLAINQFVSPAHFDFAKVKSLYNENPEILSTRASWDELAIEAAAHTGQVPMAEWLAEKGSPVSTCTAVLLNLSGFVKDALKEDPKCVFECGAHDIAILAYTVYGQEKPELAEILLKSGANVHAKALNLTPLHLAAMKGYINLAGLLLDHGADVNAVVKARGSLVSPLSLAVQSKQEKMQEFLKSRGARV